MGIFLEGEDSRGNHCLDRLVEFRFKAPPGTTSPSITTHTPSGQSNCPSWASKPQKSVTLLPCPGGRTTKSTQDMWWHWKKKIIRHWNLFVCLSIHASIWVDSPKKKTQTIILAYNFRKISAIFLSPLPLPGAVYSSKRPVTACLGSISGWSMRDL